MTTEFLPGDLLRVKRLTFTERGGKLQLTAINFDDTLDVYVRPGDQVLYIGGVGRLNPDRTRNNDDIVWHLILTKGAVGALWFSSVVFTHEL